MATLDRSKYKVGFVSLGCPKNRTDTEVMLAEVAAAGYRITPEETEADAVIVNTCAFIESAKREAIDNILDIAWLKEHGTLSALIVTGCLSQRYGEEILTDLPEVDAVLGVASIHRIVEAIDCALLDKTKKYTRIDPLTEMKLGGDRVITTGDGSAYLKISEGCNNRCAYCAIPYIRGNLRSRPIEDIVAEAKDLSTMGIKEIVLVAQDTTVYGLDLYGEYALPRLLTALTAETDIPWIRLLYCYPDKITDELIATMAANPRILPYIDLPIQHGEDGMLARMNRHGDTAVIRSAVERLRAALPNAVLRTTLITGFPGETEEAFSAMCQFIKDVPFDCLGVFPYSREEGTPAYDLPDQVDPQVAQDRADILMRTQADISARFKESFVGRTLTVLVEGYDAVSETYFGRSAYDAPDIDGKVYFTSPAGVKCTEGQFTSVKITEAMDYDLIGVTVL